MSVNPGDIESVTLLPSDVTIKQSLDMVLFTITDYALVNATDPEKGICMTSDTKAEDHERDDDHLLPLIPPDDDHL